MAKQRVVFRIEISTKAVETLQSVTDRIGITQIALSSKLIDWFAAQPDDVKAGILGLYPELAGDPATTFLKTMAKS